MQSKYQQAIRSQKYTETRKTINSRSAYTICRNNQKIQITSSNALRQLGIKLVIYLERVKQNRIYKQISYFAAKILVIVNKKNRQQFFKLLKILGYGISLLSLFCLMFPSNSFAIDVRPRDFEGPAEELFGMHEKRQAFLNEETRENFQTTLDAIIKEQKRRRMARMISEAAESATAIANQKILLRRISGLMASLNILSTSASLKVMDPEKKIGLKSLGIIFNGISIAADIAAK